MRLQGLEMSSQFGFTICDWNYQPVKCLDMTASWKQKLEILKINLSSDKDKPLCSGLASDADLY